MQPLTKIHWNSTTVLDALNEINEHHDELQNYLKFLLDDFHGVEHSFRYYDIISGDWFDHFLHWVYIHWKQEILDNTPLEERAIPVADKFSSLALAEDIDFHSHLCWSVSQLVAGESATNWQFAQDHVRIQNGQQRSHWLVRQFKKMATKKPDLLICKPYQKCSRFEWMLTLWRWRSWAAWDNLDYPISVSATVDKRWRKVNSIEIGQATNWPEIVKALLPLYLPVVLLEGFTAVRDEVLSLPIVRPKATYSANALWGGNSLIYKILNAEWQQQGTRILYHQHGGGTGLDPIYMVEDYEIRVVDQYYGWGWQRANQLVQTLSPPVFNTLKRQNKWLLLMCNDYPVVPYRIHFHPMPGTIQTMHRQTLEFLQELKCRNGLMIRPHPNDYGWMALEPMRDAAPDAKFDRPPNAPSSLKRFAQSRLVVHSYLGTSWLETLALNIPTVCFYDADVYAFSEEAQQLIEGLAKVGVLHISGVAAAHFVSNVGDEPQGWWNQPDVQEARQNFVQKYAYNSPDWARQWEEEFYSQIYE